MRVAALKADNERVYRRLGRAIAGELLTDDTSRYLYATDASYHLIVPEAVARPRHRDDLCAIARLLTEANRDRPPADRIGLTMRSAGTSLTGGCLGRGLVVDVTRYLHGVLDFDRSSRTIRVEPGMTYDELGRFLAPFGLMFPPNPASGIACELGGMWANNASGTRHVKYGPTRDWVADVTAVAASGELFRTEAVAASPAWRPAFADSLQARWASAVWPLVRDHQETIERHLPRVNKNSSGYALDALWREGTFDFAQLLVGSEGTLAMFVDARLRLAEIVPHRAVVMLFFESWEAAGHAVNEVLPLGPVAVEMVDRHLLDLARPRSAVIRDLVPTATETALLVEFEDHDQGVVDRRIADAVSRTVTVRRLAFDHRVAHAADEQERLWAVRKSAAMIGHLTEGTRKPVPFIEDCVVAPEKLPAYIREISAIFEKYQVRVAYWGHAGNGNIHVRPALDLARPEDLDHMEAITREVFAVVDRYDGSYTAEHGDGYTHSHLLARKFGALYELFRAVKETCDPLGYLNPEKIITRRADQLRTDLRMGPDDRVAVEASNRVVHDPEAKKHVENCIGLGVCKDFCPSFIGLRTEHDLTRGRTNAMRGMMTGAFGDPDRYLATAEFRAMGDTCLNCKRCAHQCPSQVDEPRHLLLARRFVVEREGMPLLEKLLASYEHFAPWGVRLSGVANRAAGWPWVRTLLELAIGVDRRRALPRFAPETLDEWHARRRPPAHASGERVVYFPGCFARYNEPRSVGQSTVEMAELLGFDVVIPRTRCSGHALETYGGDLTPNAQHNIRVLEEAAGPEAPILTTCSSCRLSLVKQYVEWFADDPAWQARARAVAGRVVDAANWGAQFLGAVPAGGARPTVAYHAPCHALLLDELGNRGALDVLRNNAGRIDHREIEQHCSGMGGTFGFKRKNRTIVETNAGAMTGHLAPLPKETVVATDCPSCRLALEEHGERPVEHPVSLVFAWLKENRGTGS
jgi:FAD/FMN-containing dehydrogenase/Fe-S oxidoreductase